jgi:enoyl-CoA hydratase/carnithine racemase
MALEGIMAFKVTTYCQGSVAIVGIENPPVNALAAGLAESVAAAIQEASEADPIKAIVVVCAGRHTSPGPPSRNSARSWPYDPPSR